MLERDQAAPESEHPGRLGNGDSIVGDGTEHQAEDDRIEACVRGLECHRVAHAERHVTPESSGPQARGGEHHGAQLDARQVPQPEEPWDRDRWLTWLPEHHNVFRALPRALDRAALRHACADAAIDEASATQALVTVTIWGYVNANYGPSRTAAMLRTPHAGHRLLVAAQTLKTQGALAAYARLSDEGGSHLDGLGPAFATKFMYFCQPVDQAPIALILDRLVSKWLAQNVGIWLPSGGWSRAVYAEYVRLIHAWASELGCAADDVECCIFRDSAAAEGNTWGR